MIIKEITLSDWSLCRDGAAALESSYDEKIRSDLDDLDEMIERKGSVAVAILDGQTVAGFAIGYPLERDDVSGYGLGSVWKPGSIYLESITLSEKYRGRGLGSKLLSVFLESAKEKGYILVTGHFRPNGSLAIVKKHGARELFAAENWFGTGERYIYCELLL